MRVFNTKTPKQRRVASAGMLAVCVVALLAAFAVNGSAHPSTQAPRASAAAQSVLAQANALVKQLSTSTGTYSSPPTTRAKAVRGKTVWVIGYSNQSVTSLALQAAWVHSIGPKLGWTVKYVDGQADPNAQVAAIRDAINAKAAGIVLQYMDCDTVKSGLLAAKNAGIPTISIDGADCLGAPLYTWSIGNVYGSINAFNAATGRAQAAWIIANSHGHANVVFFTINTAVAVDVWVHAFETYMKRCGGCTVTTVPFQYSDFGPGLQQKAQEALVKDRNATYVNALIDDTVLAGVQAGVQAAGSHAKIVGDDCQPAVLQLIQQGKAAVCFNLDPAWDAYASADALVRIFAGKKPTAQTGEGIRVVSKNVNFPSNVTQFPQPAINFQAIYLKAWGLG